MASGFKALIVSSSRPVRPNAPGLQDSTTTSAHSTRRLATSNPLEFFISMSIPSFEVLKVPKNWDMFSSLMLSLKGGFNLNGSIREPDSTLTTVAPWSASALAVIGPTPTHAKSATLSPSKGKSDLRISRSWGKVERAASSSRISFECSLTCGGFRFAFTRSLSKET